MSQEVDQSLAKILLEWGWTAVVALVGVVWKSNSKKLEDRRQGEIKLHERIDKHIAENNLAFKELMQQQSSNHSELLREIGDIKRDLPRR